MNQERIDNNKQWVEQKKENHRLNELLLSGRWHGMNWRTGLMARIALKGILK